jgi:hypothetical protein
VRVNGEWRIIGIRPDEGFIVPRGAVVHEVLMTCTEVIVLGAPATDDEDHNCDALGCGQCHVLYRKSFTEAPHA